jgi:hypothetical protein
MDARLAHFTWPCTKLLALRQVGCLTLCVVSWNVRFIAFVVRAASCADPDRMDAIAALADLLSGWMLFDLHVQCMNVTHSAIMAMFSC